MKNKSLLYPFILITFNFIAHAHFIAIPTASRIRQIKHLGIIDIKIGFPNNSQIPIRKFFPNILGRWVGRTENMDLVYAESESDLTGRYLPVRIDWTGPWTMIGTVISSERPDGKAAQRDAGKSG